MKDKKRILGPFDLFLIIGIAVCSIASSLLTGELDYLGLAISIIGVVNVVLVAKGNILNYPFGILHIVAMAIIYFSTGTWANALLYGAYFLPMNVWGWIAWARRTRRDDGKTVEARRMTAGVAAFYATFSAVAIALGTYILHLVDGSTPALDSASTIISVIAMVMQVRAYKEQWYLWVAVDAIYVVMWTINIINGVPHALPILIQYSFFLVNAVYGIINWSKLSKESNADIAG